MFIFLLAYIFILTDKMPDLKPPQVKMPSPNAYDYYIKAANMRVKSDALSLARPNTPVGYIDAANPKDRFYTLSERMKAIDDNTQAIKTLCECIKYNCFTPELGYKTLFHNFASFREMARLVTFESWNYEQMGDYKEAMRLRIDGMKLANDIQKNGGVISALVGVACQAMVSKDIYELISKIDINATKDSLTRLKAIDKSAVPLIDVYEQERWEHYKGLKRIFKEKNWRFKARYFVLYSKTALQRVRYRASWATISQREVYNNFVDYYKLIQEEAKKPLQLMHEIPKPKDLVNKLSTLNTRSFTQIFIEGTRTRTILLIALALKAYQLENKKYPDNLKQLLPKYLGALPQDPYSVNADYKYRNKGNKFLLYSIGPDGKDNAGISIKRLPGRTRTIVALDSIGDIVWGVK